MGKNAGTGPAPPHGGPRRGAPPRQPFGRAEKKNSLAPAVSDTDDLRLAERDYGIDLSAGNVCPACGARNNGGQSACWQCRAPLVKPLGESLHTPPASRRSQTHPAASTRLLERGLAATTLLVILAALGLTAGLLQQALTPETPPAVSLGQVFERNLFTTRIVVGVLLILGWPGVLHGAAGALGLRFKRPNRFLTLLAVLLGGLMYVLTFLPGPGAAAALAVPIVVAPGLFRGLLRMSWGHAARLCAVQIVALGAMLALAVWGLESIAARSPLNPLRELPVIYRLARQPAAGIQQVLPTSHGSAFPPLRWAASGSQWLDRRANQAQVEAINPERADGWEITLRGVGEEGAVGRARHGSNPWRSARFTPEPELPYSITIDSGVLQGDLIRVHSLLPLKAP